jgi:hypothetical protein
MGETPNLKSLSDDDLLRGLSNVLRQFRRDEVDLIAHIGEVDERRLYAREASPSMFAWCMEVLHLSEAETALRIGATRAARKLPARREPPAPDSGQRPDAVAASPALAPVDGRARLRGGGDGATGALGGESPSRRPSTEPCRPLFPGEPPQG